MIELSGLISYPIKSTKGMALNQATVTQRGLAYDRRWMVCDRNGKFLTQRKLPKMALIQVAVGDTLRLSIAKGSPSYTSPLELMAMPADQTPVTVDVWGDSCRALSMGENAARWLSNFLEVDCQLVYMPEDSHRPVDHGRFDSPNSFSDAYPFLLISEASLADLNHRLEQPVPMNRFRPNLVVKGCGPFEEDSWKQIKIGDLVFDVAKACARCSVPGVDQATGKQEKEPLKTLATYRRWDHAIWFGQNLITHGAGTLNVGDPIDVRA